MYNLEIKSEERENKENPVNPIESRKEGGKMLWKRSLKSKK